MNQIQQLINQMCPNGVEWKTLGEVFETRNGYCPILIYVDSDYTLLL
jgi:type I restriction enzyme S subunit